MSLKTCLIHGKVRFPTDAGWFKNVFIETHLEWWHGGSMDIWWMHGKGYFGWIQVEEVYDAQLQKKPGWWRSVCGSAGFFFSCSGQDNFESSHVTKLFLSSEELPKVLETGRDVSSFQSSISRPQILFLCHAKCMSCVCVVLLCRWLGRRGGWRWNMDYLLSVSG